MAKEFIPHIRGIFFRRDQRTFVKGEGMAVMDYWFAKGASVITLQPLNRQFAAQGRPEKMEKGEFLRLFTLEPSLSYRLITEKTARGDWYRKHGQYVEAKIEYHQVLKVDEENIRCMFGLGLSYLALNELDKASYVFERMLLMDETFSEEYKHLFNQFGIAMRKKRLFAEAVRFYARATQLCPDDENVYLNKARALYESGEVEEAHEALRRALYINPEFPAAMAFLKYLHKEGHQPEDPNLRSMLQPFMAAALHKGPVPGLGASLQEAAAPPQEPVMIAPGGLGSTAPAHSKAAGGAELALALTDEDIEFHFPALAAEGFRALHILRVVERLQQVGKRADRLLTALDHANADLEQGPASTAAARSPDDPLKHVFNTLARTGSYPRPTGYVPDADMAARDDGNG